MPKAKRGRKPFNSVALLHALHCRNVLMRVDMRNDDWVEGRLDYVDERCNLTILDAEWMRARLGTPIRVDRMEVCFRHIRSISFPEELPDTLQALLESVPP